MTPEEIVIGNEYAVQSVNPKGRPLRFRVTDTIQTWDQETVGTEPAPGVMGEHLDFLGNVRKRSIVLVSRIIGPWGEKAPRAKTPAAKFWDLVEKEPGRIVQFLQDECGLPTPLVLGGKVVKVAVWLPGEKAPKVILGTYVGNGHKLFSAVNRTLGPDFEGRIELHGSNVKRARNGRKN